MTRNKIAMMAALMSCIANWEANAGTIAKLPFSTDPFPDIELIDGVLSTYGDSIGATSGDQNTEVTFLETLYTQAAITGANASFTLENVNLVEQPTVVVNTLLQKTSGGNFALYDPDNGLMLAGTLGNGVLSGPIGGTSTAGHLTTEFGSFTGGSLMASLKGAYSSTLSISLTDVNDGVGLALNDDGFVANFSADATAVLGASVPEPASVGLTAVGLLALFSIRRKRG